MNKAEKNAAVPIWQRVTLTLEETSALTGIGINKLRDMADEPTCEFVVWVGPRRMIKRKKLEEYIEKSYSL